MIKEIQINGREYRVTDAGVVLTNYPSGTWRQLRQYKNHSGYLEAGWAASNG